MRLRELNVFSGRFVLCLVGVVSGNGLRGFVEGWSNEQTALFQAFLGESDVFRVEFAADVVAAVVSGDFTCCP